jgi:hypothetical protein
MERTSNAMSILITELVITKLKYKTPENIMPSM